MLLFKRYLTGSSVLILLYELLSNIPGYGEVSVDTDLGKVFAVAFALVGIPLMFITAADIGKFLSETLLRFVSNWNRMLHKLKVNTVLHRPRF